MDCKHVFDILSFAVNVFIKKVYLAITAVTKNTIVTTRRTIIIAVVMRRKISRIKRKQTRWKRLQCRQITKNKYNRFVYFL